MNQIININGKAIEQINYKGVPVINLPMVDELHERRKKTATNAFNRNKKKLIEGEDYFLVPKDEWKTLIRSHEMRPDQPKTISKYGGDMVFLSETGYVMLIKVFDDDLSWQIYRLMVKGYFTQRTMVSASPQKHDIKMTIDIGRLAKQADAHLDGKASLRLLNHLTGIPVNDLVSEIEIKESATLLTQPGKEAEILASYLFALVNTDIKELGIEISTDADGRNYILARTTELLEAMKIVGKANRLPKLDYDANGLGRMLAKLAPELENLGWRRQLERIISGQRYYQYTCLEILN